MRAREREGEHLLPPPPRQGTCQSEGREDGSQTRLRGNDGKEGRETCRYHPPPQEGNEHPGYCQMLPLRYFHRTTRQEIFRTIKRTPPPGWEQCPFGAFMVAPEFLKESDRQASLTGSIFYLSSRCLRRSHLCCHKEESLHRR